MAAADCRSLFCTRAVADNHIDVGMSGREPVDESQQEFEAYRGTKADSQFFFILVAARRLYKGLFKAVVVILDALNPELAFMCQANPIVVAFKELKLENLLNCADMSADG